MKKKILLIIPLLLIIFLTGCIEEIFYDDIPEPKIELKVEGQLTQVFELKDELEDVKFSLKFDNLAENNLTLADFTIVWKQGNEVITNKEDNLVHLVKIKGVYNIEVYVTVTYMFKGKEVNFNDSRVIEIIELPTKVNLTNSLDKNTYITELVKEENNKITFSASITGNLAHKDATWVVTHNGNKYEELVSLQEDMNISNGIGKLTFNYNFNEVGNYTVYLEIGKYVSDYQHINVKYGDFSIKTTTSELTQTANYSSRTLTIESVFDMIGQGTYMWYLNGNPIEGSENKLTFVHEDEEVGGYLYYAIFIPDDSDYEIQKTEPVLVANAVKVNNKEAFLNHINETKTKALFIEEDIEFGIEGFTIDYELTIVSNGKALKNDRIQDFIKVTSDNVYFKNVRLEEARQYILTYQRANNGYLENVVFYNPGADGDLINLSAALYVLYSEVTIKNTKLEFDENTTGNTGVRIDSHKDPKVSILNILGYFDDGKIMLPVASGRSNLENVKVNAVGFVEFYIPVLGSAIRRWSNEQQAVQWILNDPNKIDYEVGDYLDVTGITIDVEFGSSEEQNIHGDLEFVYLFLDFFNQFGTIEFIDVETKEVVLRYYIVDHENGKKFKDVDYEFSNDKLLYSLDPFGETFTKPIVPNIPGNYLLNISIGDESFGDALNLGYFHLTVYKKALD